MLILLDLYGSCPRGVLVSCSCWFFRRLWVILLKKKPDIVARLKEWRDPLEKDSGEMLC